MTDGGKDGTEERSERESGETRERERPGHATSAATVDAVVV